jgi:hypothetical protein
MPLSFDSAKVGQPGQMHFFVFSAVSGIITPNFQLHLHSQLKTEKIASGIKLNVEFEYFGAYRLRFRGFLQFIQHFSVMFMNYFSIKIPKLVQHCILFLRRKVIH